MKKPELVKISKTVYGCSQCADFKIEIVKPSALTAAEWQRRTEQHFADHFKNVHMREDASQAAARIVREATEE